jgi:hypothetical protein
MRGMLEVMRVLGGLELLREDFGNYSMQVSRVIFMFVLCVKNKVFERFKNTWGSLG